MINVSTRCRWLTFAALQPKWPKGWTGLTGYSDSTPLALSNDTNSFGVIEKNTEKILIVFFSTETAIERQNEFAYKSMSHDRVQPPLVAQINHWQHTFIHPHTMLQQPTMDNKCLPMQIWYTTVLEFLCFSTHSFTIYRQFSYHFPLKFLLTNIQCNSRSD